MAVPKSSSFPVPFSRLNLEFLTEEGVSRPLQRKVFNCFKLAWRSIPPADQEKIELVLHRRQDPCAVIITYEFDALARLTWSGPFAMRVLVWTPFAFLAPEWILTQTLAHELGHIVQLHDGRLARCSGESNERHVARILHRWGYDGRKYQGWMRSNADELAMEG